MVSHDPLTHFCSDFIYRIDVHSSRVWIAGEPPAASF